MSSSAEILRGRSLDTLIFDLESLKGISELFEIVTSFLEGDYRSILRGATSRVLIEKLNAGVNGSKEQQQNLLQDCGLDGDEASILRVLVVGLAAFNAFLQINVTGPVLDWRDIFEQTSRASREGFLRSLDVDGVSVYQHIPQIELFCLARLVFTVFFPRLSGSEFRDCKWMRIRLNAYHQRLLAGVSVGRLIDSNLLQDVIERDIKALEEEVLGPGSAFGTDAKVMFLLEKAQIYIMEGMDLKARENVRTVGRVAGFTYALSGALGKRTRFQDRDISQLVVFAKSREGEVGEGNGEMKGPQALDLNDDTVLESIAFTKDPDKIDYSSLPPDLAGMKPDEQPQLNALDQITLLTEATIRDNLSPLDKLNSEEILPFAVRVLSDKPTNWQIYTQALLVRSRIESHRSRTMERSVLQLQVIVDQIIADTQEEVTASENGVPEIRVTQFLPRAKADESAPVYDRLKYIFQLNSPTRWEIETELAFAWSNAGSLVSAMEIFKRLKLWPEVALCYHSVNQEEKARQIVRRQLYFSSRGPEMDSFDVDAAEVANEKWDGDVRSPPPPHAPRLWCILGDLDQNPEFWNLAWEISKHRYARAQRTLGDHYSKERDLTKAREAYMKATVVNRQNNDTWARLGDIDLTLGNWDGAMIAFQQSIMIDDTDAKTYSNLGSALLSKYAELNSLQKAASQDLTLQNDEGDEIEFTDAKDPQSNPKDILRQALSAFKRGASLAHDNWKIWDNVITIAGRMSPPSFPDLLMALRAVIRIRSPTIGEEAVDIDVLRGLVLEVTSRERLPNANPEEIEEVNGGIYTAPRGSLARATIDMIDSEVIPLITARAELWVLVEKLKIYRKDYTGALACAEKAWRMSLLGEKWMVEESEWKEVVDLTDHLVSAYENFGEGSWKGKARSAVRGVMGKGRDAWEGSSEWGVLEGLVEGLTA